MTDTDSFAIHVAATVRDCGDGLEQRLDCLEESLSAATEGRLQFHFFENDSKDSTRAQILRFQSTRSSVMVHLAEGLDSQFPRREARLAHCRNQLLRSIAAAHTTPHPASVYLPVDLDIDIDWSAASKSLNDAISIVQSGALDAIFPISEPLYYDIHALRARRWNSTDPWNAVGRTESSTLWGRVPRWIVRGALVHAKQVPSRRLRSRGRLVPVESAFGGLGVYRLDRVKDRQYQSTLEDRCEHISFNRGLKIALMTDFSVAAPPEHLGDTLFRSCAQKSLIRTARALHRIG